MSTVKLLKAVTNNLFVILVVFFFVVIDVSHRDGVARRKSVVGGLGNRFEVDVAMPDLGFVAMRFTENIFLGFPIRPIVFFLFAYVPFSMPQYLDSIPQPLGC